MTEQEIFLENLEKLRFNFGLNLTIINDLLKWGKHKYSRIHNAEQDPTLTDLIEIASIYNVSVVHLLTLNLKAPNINSVSKELRSLAKDRIGKPDKPYVKQDIIPHVTIILSENFKVNDTFTNIQIKSYLTQSLQEHFKNKSIEWSKSTLKEYVIDTGKKENGKTKPLTVYQLVMPIPYDLIEKAQNTIDEEK